MLVLWNRCLKFLQKAHGAWQRTDAVCRQAPIYVTCQCGCSTYLSLPWPITLYCCSIIQFPDSYARSWHILAVKYYPKIKLLLDLVESYWYMLTADRFELFVFYRSHSSKFTPQQVNGRMGHAAACSNWISGSMGCFYSWDSRDRHVIGQQLVLWFIFPQVFLGDWIGPLWVDFFVFVRTVIELSLWDWLMLFDVFMGQA